MGYRGQAVRDATNFAVEVSSAGRNQSVVITTRHPDCLLGKVLRQAQDEREAVRGQPFCEFRTSSQPFLVSLSNHFSRLFP